MNWKQNDAILFNLFYNEIENYKSITAFIPFYKSGAYFRAVLTLKVMTSEVVLTIEMVLTFERSYIRARTVY